MIRTARNNPLLLTPALLFLGGYWIVLLMLLLLQTTLLLAPQYLFVYGSLGVAGGLAAIALFLVDRSGSSSRSELGERVFLYEKNGSRFLSQFPLIGFFLAIILGILTVWLVNVQLEAALFPVPNPTEAGFSFGAQPASLSFTQKVFTGAVIPALFEDIIVFFGIQFTTLLALAFLRRSRTPSLLLFLVVEVASIAVWSFLFALAHIRYGGNIVAYVWAGVFQFFTQLLNSLTGGFWSWIPHLFHNAAVIQSNNFALVTVSGLPAEAAVLGVFFLIPYRRWLAK